MDETIKEMEKQNASKRVFCRRCGRELKNITAKELGFGVICYNKYMKECNLSNKKKLF